MRNEEYPGRRVASGMTVGQAYGLGDPEVAFEFGLARLLDGVEALRRPLTSVSRALAGQQDAGGRELLAEYGAVRRRHPLAGTVRDLCLAAAAGEHRLTR